MDIGTDYSLRLVSGSGGSTGGTTAFSTVFSNQTPIISASGSVGATTLSIGQIPSHSHGVVTYAQGNMGSTQGVAACGDGTDIYGTFPTTSVGGNGSHTHSFSSAATSSAITLNVQYANVIICSKN